LWQLKPFHVAWKHDTFPEEALPVKLAPWQVWQPGYPFAAFAAVP